MIITSPQSKMTTVGIIFPLLCCSVSFQFSLLTALSLSQLLHLVFANDAALEDMTYANTGSSDSGTGLMMVGGDGMAKFTIARFIFRGGLAQDPPSAYSYRTSGGAVEIAPSLSPVNVSIVEVLFVDNAVGCSQGACNGGALLVSVENTVVGDPGVLNIVSCNFTGNTVTASGTANAMLGGAVYLNNVGTADLAVRVDHIEFRDNLMKSNVGTPVVGSGCAFNVININFGDQEKIYSENLSQLFSNCSFRNNVVYSNSCGAGYAANGGATAQWGVRTALFEDCLFDGNGAICVTPPDSDAVQSMAQGGAIFLQGLNTSNAPALQPVLNITRSKFTNNFCNCTGIECFSLGAGMSIAVAASILLENVSASDNTVVCAGLGCVAQGGFAQLQNGPEVDVAVVSNMIVTGRGLNATGNFAAALATSDYPEPLDMVLGETYGGAVALLSLNGALTFTATDWHMADNHVSCAYRSCMAYGSHFGLAQLTVDPGLAASVDAQLDSSSFYCGNVTCDGQDCTASADVWNTDYWSMTQAGELGVAGEGCMFVGTTPPTGTGVTVSSSCDTAQAGATAICLGELPLTATPTAVPTATPTASPTVAPTNGTASLTATPTASPTVAPTNGTVPTATPTASPTVAPTNGTASAASGGGNQDLSEGAIAGIAIAAVALLAVASFALFYAKNGLSGSEGAPLVDQRNRRSEMAKEDLLANAHNI